MKTIIFILSLLTFTIITTTAIVKSVKFDRNCSGYLERAANANSVDLAKAELLTAIEYIERNNLTSGYTSIIYTTPDEDLGFWYTNIKTSYNELNNLSDSASSLEKSNVLIKLRETLMDQGTSSSEVTIPSGTSFYPNNTLWLILSIVDVLALICIILLALQKLNG